MNIRPVRFVFLITMLLTGCLVGCDAGSGRNNSAAPVARQGVIDLTTWDFNKDGAVDLNGEWEFYWQQLIYPKDFLSQGSRSTPGLFAVPGIWNNRDIGGRKQSGDGYATFRLRAKMRLDSPLMAIRILDETSAYQLWINGKQVASNGTVGSKRATTKPQYLLQIVHVPPDEEFLDIVLHVANFNHSKGGVWNPLTLGVDADITRKQELKWALDFFLFGSLLIMGVYHIGLFLLRRKETSVLYFGLFCMVVACRTALTENRIFTSLFPDFSWELVFKVELLTVHAAFLLLLLFIHSLYPVDCSRWFMRFLQGVCLSFGLVTLATYAKISSLLVEPFHPVIIVIQGYVFYVLIKAILCKRDGAATILTGLAIFFLTVVNDILHNHGVITTLYIAPFGFLFLVISQSFVLARRYTQAFITVERLSSEREENILDLSQKNLQICGLVSTLQQEIDMRNEANRALEIQMEERIHLESEIVRVSDNERQRISYELHDGLCQQLTGARLRWAALEGKLAIAGASSAEVQSLGRLLDETVSHAYNLSRGLWSFELDYRSLEEVAWRMSEQSGIAIEFHQQPGCKVCTAEHHTQIHRIAQEAIANAVKHSRATLITVSLKCDVEGGVFMEVRDNGTGRTLPAKTSGGMGVGIMTHRAMMIGGHLEISDADGGGTVVVCSVPCNGQTPLEGQYV